MNITRPWHIAVIFAVVIGLSFAAGYLTGSGTTRQAMRSRFDPERWNTYAMQVLDERLHLQTEQRAAIQQAIDRAVTEMKTVRQETVQRTRHIVKDLLTSIGDKLTPEQQKAAEALAPSEEELTIDLLKVN